MAHYASDAVKPNLTVAAAWSSLRRCWRAYKIAINESNRGGRNKDGRDDERRVEYARRIVSLCKLLNIEPPYFMELDFHEEMEERGDEEVSVEGSIAYNDYSSMQSSFEGNRGNNFDDYIGGGEYYRY
jgi:hypothetical protein